MQAASEPQSDQPVRQAEANPVSQHIDSIRKAPEAAYIFADIIVKVSLLFHLVEELASH